MTFHARLAASSLMLAAVLGACSPPPEKAATPAEPPAVEASADVHVFRIGQLQAAALRDGELAFPATDREMSPWSDTAEVASLLTSSGQTDGQVHLSIQPLLVRTGDRVILIDAGAGGQMGTEGKLQASLRAAGVEPAQVTEDLSRSLRRGVHSAGVQESAACPSTDLRQAKNTTEAAGRR